MTPTPAFNNTMKKSAGTELIGDLKAVRSGTNDYSVNDLGNRSEEPLRSESSRG